MTLTELLSKIRQLDAAATNGPWYQVGPLTDEESGKPGGVGVKLIAHPVEEDETGELVVDAFQSRKEERDAEFIALARTALPLLAEICERQRVVMEVALQNWGIATMNEGKPKQFYLAHKADIDALIAEKAASLGLK